MRQTNDADVVIRMTGSNPDALASAFSDPYYVSKEEIASALASSDEFRTIQLLHTGEAFKIDLFLLRDGDFESSELERARRIEIVPNGKVAFYAPENIVIAKLRWYVLGNRVSDRQWNDIVQVLEVQHGKLDDDYLDQWTKHFGVYDLLTNARSQVSDKD